MKIQYTTSTHYTDPFIEVVTQAFGPFSREHYDPNDRHLILAWVRVDLIRSAVGKTCTWITHDPGMELWLTMNMPEGAKVL